MTAPRPRSEVGTAKTAALSPPAPRYDPSIYDGNWTALLACDSFEELSSGSRQIPATVAGGIFTMDWGVKGSPEGGHAEGGPSSDGSLTLRGTSIARSKRSSVKTIGVRFDGNATGQRFELRGHIGLRNCTLSLARSG